jgi:hypothetical protein
MNHLPGVEVAPGIWTTNDPKYNWDHNLKRMVNSGHGRPIPDDVPVMTFLGHDMAALAGIEAYQIRAMDLRFPKSHLVAADERYNAFSDFYEQNPQRMKVATTTPPMFKIAAKSKAAKPPAKRIRLRKGETTPSALKS